MREAPKEVKLWIQILVSEIRKTVEAAIDQLYPDLWTNSSP